MLRAIAILWTAFLATYAACDAHADADRCAADLARARADVSLSLATTHRSWGTDEGIVSRELLQAAQDRLAAVDALCETTTMPALVAKINPVGDDPLESYGWRPPIPVPAPIPPPYLTDPLVESECPGPNCPIVWEARP